MLNKTLALQNEKTCKFLLHQKLPLGTTKTGFEDCKRKTYYEKCA